MRKSTALAAACVSALSCGSAKLTENSGRDLLVKQTSGTVYVVSLAGVAPLLNHTQVDYSSTTLQGPPAVVKQLIQKHLVTQQTQTISYPMISGVFDARAYSTDKTQFQEEQLDIQMLP